MLSTIITYSEITCCSNGGPFGAIQQVPQTQTLGAGHVLSEPPASLTAVNKYTGWGATYSLHFRNDCL